MSNKSLVFVNISDSFDEAMTRDVGITLAVFFIFAWFFVNYIKP